MHNIWALQDVHCCKSKFISILRNLSRTKSKVKETFGLFLMEGIKNVYFLKQRSGQSMVTKFMQHLYFTFYWVVICVGKIVIFDETIRWPIYSPFRESTQQELRKYREEDSGCQRATSLPEIINRWTFVYIFWFVSHVSPSLLIAFLRF